MGPDAQPGADPQAGAADHVAGKYKPCFVLPADNGAPRTRENFSDSLASHHPTLTHFVWAYFLPISFTRINGFLILN